MKKRVVEKILFTKNLSEDQIDRLSKLDIVCSPLFNYIPIKDVDLPEMDRIRTVIFTSARAVTVASDKFDLEKLVKNRTIYAVGQKTADAIKDKAGVESVIGSAGAESMLSGYDGGDALFLCGRDRMDSVEKTFQTLDIPLSVVELYFAEKSKFSVDIEQFDAIAFFSPSGVKSCRERSSLEEKVIFAIGSSTAKEIGDGAIVADYPSVDSVIDKILEYVSL